MGIRPITTFTVTNNTVGTMLKAVGLLTRKRVLVGVPASKTGRKNNEPITNAALAYIHEHGAPSRNIPPRPFLRPGVADARVRILKLLDKAARAAIDGKPNDVDRWLNAAGLVAVSSVRKKITEGPFVPLSQRTLDARKRRGVTRTKPLIDTGQLRQSITYVIRRTV